MPEAFDTLPGWALPVIGILLAVQLTLQVFALLDLVRRPQEQLVTGKRWVWLLVIVLGEILGPIIYFAAGRKPAVVQQTAASAAPPDAAGRAVDVLYGDRGEQPPAAPEA